MNLKITAGILLLIIVLFRKKSLPLFFKLTLNCVFGMGIIFAVNSAIPAISVGYNNFSIAISSLFGVPGAVLLCLMDSII